MARVQTNQLASANPGDHLSAGRKLIPQALFFIFAAIISYDYTLIRFALNQQYLRARLADLVNGTAAVPFQYRVLAPGLVNLLTRAHLPFPPFDSPLHLFQLFEFLSTLLLIVAYRHYLRLFFPDAILSSLLSLALVLILPFNFLLSRTGAYFYPWDTPSILFFTLGLTLLYRKKMSLYYLLFILATFNRETTCFLTFIMLLTAGGGTKRKTLFFHAAAQLVIWITIKYLLFRLYAGNPGVGLFQRHWSGNLEYLAVPANYAILLSSMGFIWAPTLLLYKKIQDDFARRALLVVFPFFLGIAYVAKIGELRHYGELIPVILTGFLLILKEMLKPESPS